VSYIRATARCVRLVWGMDKPCPTCGKESWIIVEYGYPHPEAYDGASEYRCLECGTRIGRWTGKILADGEWEKRFGKQ
jgi:DNA-directed RNA polymerase subunit RPC12/RpoP